MATGPDLDERLARLEAWVAWLVEREQARQGGAPASAATPPPPAPDGARAAESAAGAARSIAELSAAAAPAAPREPSWWSNPQHVVAAVGAAFFLAGVVFLMWLSFERGWIGPEIRIALGFATGALLCAAATRLLLRGEHPQIGASLLAAGLGTFEFTGWAGAAWLHLLPETVGFSAVGAAVVFAGGLAARVRSGGALLSGLLAGYAAPALFSTGAHHEIGLSLYLLGLTAIALVVFYRGGVGGRWKTVRFVLVVAGWAYHGFVAADALRGDRPLLMALACAHTLATAVVVWLPRHPEPRPVTPTTLHFGNALAWLGVLWGHWQGLDLPQAHFSIVVLGLGALQLALVGPVRRRLAARTADLGLGVLAVGHLALAVPVALDWHWVGPLWAALALGLAWAARRAPTWPSVEPEEVATLRRLAGAMALVATLRWIVIVEDGWAAALDTIGRSAADPTPWIDELGALGLMVALALLMLARPGLLGLLGLALAEVVGVVTIAVEVAATLWALGVDPGPRAMAVTLVLSLSGAAQWLAGVREREPDRARALTGAGLSWLFVSSVKLVFVDMADADLAVRAGVFLGVGAVFLAATVMAARLRVRGRPNPGDLR